MFKFILYTDDDSNSRGTVSCIERQFNTKYVVVLVWFNNLKYVLCIKYVVIKGNGV